MNHNHTHGSDCAVCKAAPIDRAKFIRGMIRSYIKSHGFAIIGTSKDTLHWVYTVGLYAHIGCELISFATNQEMAMHMFNFIFEDLKAGKTIEYMKPYDDWATCPVIFYPAPKSEDRPETYNDQANVYYGFDVPLVQMEPSDKYGRFHQSPLYDSAMGRRQVFLYTQKTIALLPPNLSTIHAPIGFKEPL